MNDFFIPFGHIFSLFRSKIPGLYNYGYNVIHGATAFNAYGRDREKLTMVLSNPAVLKVFALQCDLFSMGKVTVTTKDGQEIEDDPFLSLIQRPNPFSNQSQFLFDYMFWLMLGTSYAYVNSRIVDNTAQKVYFLDPSKIEWPHELEKEKDKLIFSDSKLKSILKTIITYRYDDGTKFEFPFDRMVMSFDLTNGVGNFFKGVSRVDALYKVISNAEHALDSENINIRYSGKFLVGSGQQTGSTTSPGMGQEEKDDLVKKIDTMEKRVWPFRSKINIAGFVEDLAALQLPQEYLHQYFLIGNMYNIPRDVLEAYNSATYENQEKARAAHANYTLDPKGNQFMDAFENHFGYKEQGRNIKISWDHLPFMQVFAKQNADTKKVQVEVLNSLLALGVDIEQANKFLGTEFEITEPPAQQPNEQGQEGIDQGGQEENAIPEEPKGKEPIAKRNGQKVNGLHLQVSDD